MSIGLMDADMMRYHLIPFNIQIMKLSSYYKQKHEIVVLSPDFSPERNKLFYYIKDYDDGAYPPNLLKAPNVKFSGHAFSGSAYKALPLEIEQCQPDTSIYHRMRSLVTGSGTRMSQKVFDNMTNAEHIQISIDDKTVWDKWSRQLKNIHTTRDIMFHDYDLNAIDGGWDCVQEIVRMGRQDGWKARVGMKWPIQVSNHTDLMKWSSLNPNSTFYSIAYNGIMDTDSFEDWVAACYEKSIYNQIDYNVCRGSYTPNDFVKTGILEIFKQVIISRSYRAFFTLKYDDEFFFDKRWIDVLQLMNYYQHSMQGIYESVYYKKINNDTMFDFVKKSIEGETNWKYEHYMSREKIREVFYFVQEFNPELFDAFYHLNFQSLKGG